MHNVHANKCIQQIYIYSQQGIRNHLVKRVRRDGGVEKNLQDLHAKVDALRAQTRAGGFLCRSQGEVEDFDEIGEAVEVVSQFWSGMDVQRLNVSLGLIDEMSSAHDDLIARVSPICSSCFSLRSSFYNFIFYRCAFTLFCTVSEVYYHARVI